MQHLLPVVLVGFLTEDGQLLHYEDWLLAVFQQDDVVEPDALESFEWLDEASVTNDEVEIAAVEIILHAIEEMDKAELRRA